MGKRITEIIDYLFDAVLSVIYPNNGNCVVCKMYIDQGNICTQCKSKIKMCSEEILLNKENFKLKCYSVSYYSKTMRDLILKLKYKSNFQAGEVIGELMIEFIKNKNIKFDLVTFVPMTRKTIKKRGYNQSEFLAKIVSKNFKVPLVKCIRKVKDTGDQIGLGERARWQNLSNCFKSSTENRYFDKKVLIIDDVVTTGATAYYCAKQIYISGCFEVLVLTAAKSRI